MLLCEMLRACKAVTSAHSGPLGSPVRYMLLMFSANAVLLLPGRNATLLVGRSVPGF